MSRYWTELVGKLTPYVPGEQPRGQRLVKLNTNECPYPPAPAVLAAIAATTAEQLRLYPDPGALALRQAWARRCGLDAGQVFAGNGSDEVLGFAFMALLKQSLPLYFADITYSFYPVWSELCGIAYREVPVRADFSIAVRDFPQPNGGVVIANPNAPTGIALELDDLRELLELNTGSVVVVDEAYVDFGAQSAAALIPEFDNLLVVQTLSKSYALAGLRVGFAMGHPDLIEALDRVKNSFNSYPLGVLSQQAALAALSEQAYFDANCRRIVASRERLRTALAGLGFRVLPSAANFLFAAHDTQPAAQVFAQLRERGVLVRHFNRPRIDNYLRISIGTDDDCNALLAALREIVA